MKHLLNNCILPLKIKDQTPCLSSKKLQSRENNFTGAEFGNIISKVKAPRLGILLAATLGLFGQD